MVFGRKPGKKAAKKPKAKKTPKAKKSRKAKKSPKPARKAAEGVVVKKRPTDIYSVMLLMSLGFVLMATLFLVLELGSYGFSFGNLTPWK